jgi:hypothetical protein
VEDEGEVEVGGVVFSSRRKSLLCVWGSEEDVAIRIVGEAGLRGLNNVSMWEQVLAWDAERSGRRWRSGWLAWESGQI